MRDTWGNGKPRSPVMYYRFQIDVVHTMSVLAAWDGAAVSCIMSMTKSKTDFNPFPLLITSDVISDFASSPLQILSDDTRFFCTYHLEGWSWL